MVKISSFEYALSVIYTKSLTSGAYISSYLEAISIAVTPISYNLVLAIDYKDRNLSIKLIVRNSVSGSNLNFKWTSINQSTSIALIFSLISFYFVRYPL